VFVILKTVYFIILYIILVSDSHSLVLVTEYVYIPYRKGYFSNLNEIYHNISISLH